MTRQQRAFAAAAPVAQQAAVQLIAERLAADGLTVVGTATTDSGAERITAYLKEAGNAGCGKTRYRLYRLYLDWTLGSLSTVTGDF